MEDNPPPRDKRVPLTWDGFLAILFVAWINFLCYGGVMSDLLTTALGLPPTLAAGIAVSGTLTLLSVVLVFALALRSARKKPGGRASHGEELAADGVPRVEQPARCKRCGTQNPAGQQQCIKCGTAMDIPRFQVRRPGRAGSGRTIYVNDYRFKYIIIIAFLLMIPWAIWYYLNPTTLPDDVEQYVLRNLSAERSLEVVDHKELKVVGERKREGVTEAWCVEVVEEGDGDGFTTYVVTRADELAASPPYRNKQCQDWMEW